MKLIPKMQSGAMFSQYVPHELPLAAFSWLWASQQPQGGSRGSGASSSSSSSSKSSGDVGLLTKDMIKLLYENGLPNDVEKFLNTVDVFGSSLSGPFAALSSPQIYKEIITGMAKLKLNKELYNLAIQEARKNGTLNQPAIDVDGNIFVKTNSGITKKRVSQLSEKDIANVLSYGDLAKIRAYDPSVAMDNGFISDIIAGGTSLSHVAKTIQDVAEKIGTTKQSRDDIRLRSAREQDIIEGVQEIMESPEKYSFIEKTTTKQSTQRDKALIATRYILDKLSKQERAVVEFLAKVNGISPLQIIADGINYTLDDSLEQLTSWQKYNGGSDSNSGSSSSSSTRGKTYEMNLIMQIVTGDGLLHQPLSISPGGTYAYQVDALVVSWIPKAGGNGNIAPGNATEVLLNSELGRVLDTDSMHIGNLRIDVTQLAKMYWDGSKSYAVTLPITYDKNGKVMPNWALLEGFTKALDEIKRRSKTQTLSQAQINLIFKNNGLGDYFTSNGELNLQKFMRFLGISLIADESVFQNPDDYPEWFTKIDDDYLRDKMSSELGADKKNPLKLDGDLFRGVIYVPIYDSFSNARVASGLSPWVSDPGYVQQLAEEQMIERELNSPQIVTNNYQKSQL